jgi:hypothetical protein
MPQVEVDVETKLPPEGVIAALTDFSDRRPDIWSGLNRDQYEVYEVGDTWAEVREGSNKKIWARERYDWSTPGTVTWTVIDSPFSSTGDCLSATVTPSGTGSHVHISWRRKGMTAGSRVMLGFLRLFMPTILRRYVTSASWRSPTMKETLDGIASGTSPGPATA